MIVELVIAVVFGFCAYVGWFGVIRSGLDFVRLFMALAILAVSAFQLFEAIDLSVTSQADIGQVRKVDTLAIVAAIIAIWCAPKWLAPKSGKAS